MNFQVKAANKRLFRFPRDRTNKHKEIGEHARP